MHGDLSAFRWCLVCWYIKFPHRRSWLTVPAAHHQVGRLWTALADYFIRQGMFEKARDVYEEGLTTVITVRDFSLIFDALTTFETSLLEARLAVCWRTEDRSHVWLLCPP